MPYSDGSKSGGRRAGSVNKNSKELRAFLDRVFARALDEAYEVELALRIKTFQIDGKLLAKLLEYWAGAPPKTHNHTGSVSLAALIAGTAPDDAEDDE